MKCCTRWNGNWHEDAQADAERRLLMALDGGVTLFDTAAQASLAALEM